MDNPVCYKFPVQAEVVVYKISDLCQNKSALEITDLDKIVHLHAGFPLLTDVAVKQRKHSSLEGLSVWWCVHSEKNKLTRAANAKKGWAQFCSWLGPDNLRKPTIEHHVAFMVLPS